MRVTMMLAGLVVGGASTLAHAGGAFVATEFSTHCSVDSLGPVPGAPSIYGGVAFAPGDPNTLLIGVNAVDSGAEVYSIGVVRGCFGEVVGYVGSATLVASTPFIDGGLTTAGSVMLYTTFDGNMLGQVRSGSAVADRMIDLTQLGVVPSTGSLTIVPDGFPGAGRLKIASYDEGDWYDAALVPDGVGTFDVVDVEHRADAVGDGLEGVEWIEGGQAGFGQAHLLVNNWDGDRVDVLEVDANGDPIIASRRAFVFMNRPEGAAGDPLTPDIVVSSMGDEDDVVVIRILGPCVADIAPPGGDGNVDATDLFMVLSEWNMECTLVNFDRRDTVGFSELLGVISAWGPCD